MKILSLFDGISCARVALERAGIPVEVYYASEVDKYAIQISQKNWPDIIQLGSVVGLVPPKDIDLLIGGSPCQDLSIAKKDRKGLDGSRSGLFWEYVRILKEAKPKYFVLENVNSMPKEAKQVITEALGVEPIMIDAALVSAQRRKRLFWTNIPNVGLPEDRGILLKDILEDGEVDREKSYCIDANYHKGASYEDYLKKGRRQLVLKPKSNTIRAGGRNSGLGDKHEWDSIWRETKGGKVPTLTANMGTGGNNVPYVPLFREKKGRIAGWSEDEKTVLAFNGDKKRSTIAEKVYHKDNSKTYAITLANTPKHYRGGMIRKLSPVECERLQSLPDGYTEGVSNTQRYKALGNAFNVEVVAHILKSI